MATHSKETVLLVEDMLLQGMSVEAITKQTGYNHKFVKSVLNSKHKHSSGRDCKLKKPLPTTPEVLDKLFHICLEYILEGLFEMPVNIPAKWQVPAEWRDNYYRLKGDYLVVRDGFHTGNVIVWEVFKWIYKVADKSGYKPPLSIKDVERIKPEVKNVKKFEKALDNFENTL